MATIHINLEQIISEKINDKIEEAVNNAIEKAFSNIVIETEPQIVEKDSTSSDDSCNKGTIINEESKNKESENKVEDDFKRGWVEKLNAYKLVIDQMKSQLTNEQLENISISGSNLSIKEYSFKKFLDNLTWEQLNSLFRNNKYLSIDIVSDDVNFGQLELYGVAPIDIYYKLLRQIIYEQVNKLYEIKYVEDHNVLTDLILNEFYKDFESKKIGLTDRIVQKYHIEIFDYLFGVKFYMPEKENS